MLTWNHAFSGRSSAKSGMTMAIAAFSMQPSMETDIVRHILDVVRLG